MNCAEHVEDDVDRMRQHVACQEMICRAQGTLMAAHNCSAQVAAGILTGVARSSGTELHTVAGTVVTVAEQHSQSPPEAIRAAITCALRNVLS
ncbi:ANTAR domain-containing protein [Streptomyces bathyalis]|uniref:ANTAR domain-containing protein n=1 Tax=Streptomyces bathyalis TaxID=2710756 RepID=A0A7T1T5J3_9ACTN|nr:ANTAR domain-containing protein [Streptomyces bathyalis]QPP06781.1 ANTAR domain-containing protein [Streptomyces bathyalis]